jgi:hypothetical protein
VDHEAAAVELCRRVLVCYLERQAKIYASVGQLAERDVCLLMAHQIRTSQSDLMHHLRQAVAAARRGEADPSATPPRRLPPGRR